jgi:hypothetical protein
VVFLNLGRCDWEKREIKSREHVVFLNFFVELITELGLSIFKVNSINVKEKFVL